MEGFSFSTGHFTQALGRPARGGSQHHLFPHIGPEGHQNLQREGFTRTRLADEDRDPRS